MKKFAIFSKDRLYRYRLDRQWGDEPALPWIMLNPSTADEVNDDPTIRRCMSFSKAWGYGGVVIMNLFALRSTNPKLLYNHPDPIGRGNISIISGIMCYNPEAVMMAWGAHPIPYKDWMVKGVKESITALAAINVQVNTYCLGKTNDGSPKHPLYVAARTERQPWP